MVNKQQFLEQIERYYNHNLKSFELIKVGMTPEIYIRYGVERLPIMMQQSTLTKCIRKRTGSRSAHELQRGIIESLPEQIEKPIFLIQDKARASIAIVSDAKDKESNNILVAIKLCENKNSMNVNMIKSIYGKTNLKEYCLKHIELNQLHVMDNKKAEMLSRVIGLQLPKALIASSYIKNLPSDIKNVNTNISIRDKLVQFQKEVCSKDSDRPQKQAEHRIERD